MLYVATVNTCKNIKKNRNLIKIKNVFYFIIIIIFFSGFLSFFQYLFQEF